MLAHQQMLPSHSATVAQHGEKQGSSMYRLEVAQHIERLDVLGFAVRGMTTEEAMIVEEPYDAGLR